MGDIIERCEATHGHYECQKSWAHLGAHQCGDVTWHHNDSHRPAPSAPAEPDEGHAENLELSRPVFREFAESRGIPTPQVEQTTTSGPYIEWHPLAEEVARIRWAFPRADDRYGSVSELAERIHVALAAPSTGTPLRVTDEDVERAVKVWHNEPEITVGASLRRVLENFASRQGAPK